MKTTIRTKFTLGIIFFFIIVAALSIFSVSWFMRLSKKTDMILNENHLSVAYAQGMSECLTNIHSKVTNQLLFPEMADSSIISKEITKFNSLLQAEKNNITEEGEGKLVVEIEESFNEYRMQVEALVKASPSQESDQYFRTGKFDKLYQKLSSLSEINGNAIHEKTKETNELAQKAQVQVSILATLCFILALSFTYSVASYFSSRFSQLSSGIREIVSSNYTHRLHFEGKDEFQEISLAFNEMAQQLHDKNSKMNITLPHNQDKNATSKDIIELKELLVRLKSTEEQAQQLISRLDLKQDNA